MIESLGGLIASRAGCIVIVLSGQVGAEGAFSRSDLVEPSRVKFVDTHQVVRSGGGGIWVPGRDRGPGLPFFHEQVAATLP